MRPYSVYVAAGPQVRTRGGQNSISKQDMTDILAKHALNDRQTQIRDIEQDMKSAIEDVDVDTDGKDRHQDSIKTLHDTGYVTDDKRWLTRRGFEAVGRAILRDIMKSMRHQDVGDHQSVLSGHGQVLQDTTRALRPEDTIQNINIEQTLLNATGRVRRAGFPMDIHAEDIQVHETHADARAAVVYCIDLSSTMRTKMRNGTSRMAAAKKALWGLYGVNTRYYPADTIHIVGFASMASRVEPHDIPYLRTFDADGFLHYTNYEAAFRLARRILNTERAQNKKIVLVTDGQPSACLVANQYQADAIRDEKPYSNLYAPDVDTISRMNADRGMRMHAPPEMRVYLCYRYKRVDPRIDYHTMREGLRCTRQGMQVDIVAITDEVELVEYCKDLSRRLGGRMFHVQENMAGALVSEYVRRYRQ